MTFEQKNVLLIDNFYNNPDEVREYALSLPYRNDVHGEHFWRTTPRLNLNIIPNLESYIGTKIERDHLWVEHPEDEYVEMNMSFYKVINNPDEDYVRANHIHHDWTHWSGIVYLSPDISPSNGTQLWRHKLSGDEFAYGDDTFSINDARYDLRCDEPAENWEKTDYIAYKYNRLFLFRGTMFHSSAHTESMPDGDRLNQFFYFNQQL